MKTKYRLTTNIYSLTRIEKESFLQRVLVEFTSNDTFKFVLNDKYKDYVIQKWANRKLERFTRDIEINNTTTKRKVKI